jgi:glyoxylase-like metal-dependent hydrolase (beta-lactamase superfamily II)
MSPSSQQRPKAIDAKPLPVAERCWMIGHRNPASLLQCNTYLRIFPGARHGTSICVDPGSQFDATVVESNIQDLTGGSGLDFITVNHQDPDVTGNLPSLCESNPDATVILTEDTWRLVQHLLVSPGALSFPHAFSSRLQTLPGGIGWQPVPTPFCHFRGAMAFYDPESQILFSGDLFGGLNQVGRIHLFAEEGDWGGIAQFHQIYMPSREILRYAVRQIRALRPAVKMIAPQHGHVITGDLLPLFLDQMEQLFVGYDLLALELDEQYEREYGDLVSLIIDDAMALIGEKQVSALLSATTFEDELDQLLTKKGERWRARRSPYACSAKVFFRLAHDKGPALVNQMRNAVLRFCCDNSVPVPPIGWGMEGGQVAVPSRAP